MTPITIPANSIEKDDVIELTAKFKANKYRIKIIEMEWIDIKTKKPSSEDVGKEYLVAVKMTSRYEYQIAEWCDMGGDETELGFNIKHSWCGQEMISKEVTHWSNIDELTM